MSHHFVARMIVASLVVPLGISLGCDGKSPSAPTQPPVQTLPTQPPVPVALGIASVYPRVGATGGSTALTIKGFGFGSGATVTFDGIPARITSQTGLWVAVQTPEHAPGTVDVVLTNPDGQSSRLTRGFTYAVFTLTVSPEAVTPGGQLSVRWVSPGGSVSDWIALYKVGDPNTSYTRWWDYTNGASSGTFAISAPTEPGEYELRYLLDDDFIDVARSPLHVK